jgi:hypothetical protein
MLSKPSVAAGMVDAWNPSTEGAEAKESRPNLKKAKYKIKHSTLS